MVLHLRFPPSTLNLVRALSNSGGRVFYDNSFPHFSDLRIPGLGKIIPASEL